MAGSLEHVRHCCQKVHLKNKWFRRFRLLFWYVPGTLGHVPPPLNPSGAVRLGEPWQMTQPVGMDWQATASVVSQGARPAVLRLVIELSDPDRFPIGGLGSRDLRRVSLPALRQVFVESLNRAFQPTSGQFPPEAIALLALGFTTDRPPGYARRPGRRGHPSGWWAKWALDYVELLASGSPHPIKALAAERRCSREYARQQIHHARDRGFLTDAPASGVAGGELTELARRELAQVPSAIYPTPNP
jgi:hypothetical protein